MSTDSAFATFLLSIRGALAPETLEAARSVHNDTAGAPANVDAARGLGDLSHMVYVPMARQGQNANGHEFLILDQWNSLEGLNQFFADPHVQQGGGMIFRQRDPVVWAPAEGFYGYHFPAPYGRNERIVGLVRGRVASQAAAQATHNAFVAKTVNMARRRGSLSHEAFFRLAPAGSAEASEFFAVDVWMDAAGMGEQYQDPAFMAGFQQLFVAQPAADVWAHPAGDWVEW